MDGESSPASARRDWYANLHQHRFTFHLEHGVHADLGALATPVDDAERARVFASVIDDLKSAAQPAGIPSPSLHRSGG